MVGLAMRQNIWVLYNFKTERFMWNTVSTTRRKTIKMVSFNFWPEKYCNKEARDLGWKHLYRLGWRAICYLVPRKGLVYDVPEEIILVDRCWW